MCSSGRQGLKAATRWRVPQGSAGLTWLSILSSRQKREGIACPAFNPALKRTAGSLHQSCLTSTHPLALCHAFMRPACCHCQQGCAQPHSDTCWQQFEGCRAAGRSSAAASSQCCLCALFGFVLIMPGVSPLRWTPGTSGTHIVLRPAPGAQCCRCTSRLGVVFITKPCKSPLGWNTINAGWTTVLPPAAGTHC